MANTVLVGLPLEDGKKLIDALEAGGFPLKAAFWLYFEEPDEWRLVLASPVVDDEGIRKAYERILTVLSARKDITSISASDTTVRSPNDEMVKTLRYAYDKRPDGDGLLVRSAIVSGGKSSVFVKAAYVYFARL